MNMKMKMKAVKRIGMCCLFAFFSASPLAGSLPKTVNVIIGGKAVASLELPASAKIDVIATKAGGETKSEFTGEAKMSITLPSGEVIKLNAEHLEVIPHQASSPALSP